MLLKSISKKSEITSSQSQDNITVLEEQDTSILYLICRQTGGCEFVSTRSRIFVLDKD